MSGKVCTICLLSIDNAVDGVVTCNGCFSYLHTNCISKPSDSGIYSCCLNNITIRNGTGNRKSKNVATNQSDNSNTSSSTHIFTQGQSKILSEDLQLLQNNIASLFNSQFYTITNTLEDIKNQLSSFKTQIDQNTTEINTIRSQISSLSDTLHNALTPTSQPICDTTSEIMDRLERSSNIIIFNLAPRENILDKDLVSNLLSHIDNINTANIHIQRFKNSSGEVQPILAKLSSKAEVDRVLRNWKKFPTGIQISADYTEQQRQHYKKLKDEAIKHNQAHPDNENIVRYINGNPTLIRCF